MAGDHAGIGAVVCLFFFFFCGFIGGFVVFFLFFFFFFFFFFRFAAASWRKDMMVGLVVLVYGSLTRRCTWSNGVLINYLL